MSNVSEYLEYLELRKHLSNLSGFEPVLVPNYLYDFQKDLVEWAVKMGRCAIFADCGMGKSVMELVWADNVVRKTNGNVLLITPLAVGKQMIKEAAKFDIGHIGRSQDGKVADKITITNYERLHYFDPADFAGVILDESSILKNFNGARKHEINIFVRKIEYRLLATATAAPNDYIELGTSSEALGYLGYTDMLSKFFKNDQNNIAINRRGGFTEATKWRLKGHAHDTFWRWVTSWSRAIRKPSDLGFEDDGFVLPELTESEHELDVTRKANPGELFTFPANGLKEVRDERRATVEARCEYVYEIVTKRWTKENRRDKLATCGNQNTQKTGEGNTQSQKKSGPGANNNHGAGPRTRNTCRDITAPIKNNSKDTKPNDLRNAIDYAESDTQMTLSTESAKNPMQEAGIERSAKQHGFGQNTKSPLHNTTQFLKGSKAGVPSAEPPIGCMLTTATIPELSGESFARNVTLESENSATQQNDLNQLSDTLTKNPLRSSWIVWVNLNDEQRLLEQLFGDLCFSVHGSQSVEEKESLLEGFMEQERPVLITKPRVAGFGLNLQFCHNVTFFPNYSYEQYYQAIRRCWRFGQKNPVDVELVYSHGDHMSVENLKRKQHQADVMFTMMVKEMNNSLHIDSAKDFTAKTEVPAWL